MIQEDEMTDEEIVDMLASKWWCSECQIIHTKEVQVVNGIHWRIK